MMRKARRASTATVATYRDDPLYPRIERAVTGILARGKVVAPVDVLVDMGLLAPEKLEDWRRGRVRYLEAVIVTVHRRCRGRDHGLGVPIREMAVAAARLHALLEGRAPPSLPRPRCRIDLTLTQCGGNRWCATLCHR